MVKYFIYSALVVGIVDFFASNYVFAYKDDTSVHPVGYDFDIADDYIKSTSKWLHGPVDVSWLKREHYPESGFVDREKAKEICRRASVVAVTDFYENETDTTLYRYFLNSQYPRKPLVKCSTVPPSYLNLFESDKMVILMKENKYKLLKFKATLVMPNFEPKTCPEIVRNLYPNCTDEVFFKKKIAVTCGDDHQKSLRKNPLAAISNHGRLNACVAAQYYVKKVAHHVPFSRMPYFQGAEVEPAQSFELKYKDGYKRKIALRCPTNPRMYVYYSNLRVNSDMHVLLVHQSNEGRSR